MGFARINIQLGTGNLFCICCSITVRFGRTEIGCTKNVAFIDRVKSAPHLFLMRLFKYKKMIHIKTDIVITISFKLQILFVELLHCFGVALLVFRVLPHFGSFFALGIINGIAVIPGWLLAHSKHFQ